MPSHPYTSAQFEHLSLHTYATNYEQQLHCNLWFLALIPDSYVRYALALTV